MSTCLKVVAATVNSQSASCAVLPVAWQFVGLVHQQCVPTACIRSTVALYGAARVLLAAASTSLRLALTGWSGRKEGQAP